MKMNRKNTNTCTGNFMNAAAEKPFAKETGNW
jgi:hypothetical protein